MDEINDVDTSLVFEKFRVEIVRSVETEKQFIQCYLRSKFVLDDEDCERISSGATRQERVGKLLDILSLKGPDACNHFIDALEFENPKLYEKITGKKADARLTPVPHETGDNAWDWTIGMDGKALIDFDRQFLAKQLDRAVQDLKNMTYWHSKIVEEKNVLERKLCEATDDLQTKEKCMEDLKEEIIQLVSSRQAEETERNCRDSQKPMHDYLQELWRENMEKSRVMIALQGKLILANEQIENLKKANNQVSAKNDSFKNQIRELTIINDYESKKSLKMSKSASEQTDELNKELLKWKFKYSLICEEKESLQQELDSFQKWTEVLNVRFDALKQEKNALQDNSENLSSRFNRTQDYVGELEAKHAWQNFKVERSAHEANRLKAALETVRIDRDKLMHALEEVKESRTEVEKEVSQLRGALENLRERHETDMESQRALFDDLSKKHMHLLEELKAMEDRAYEAEKCQKMAELALERKERSKETPQSSSLSENQSDGEDGPEEMNENVEDEEPYFLKHKRTRDSLIDSIRRKLGCQDRERTSSKASTLPSNFRSPMNRQLLDFEQILMMNPSTLSPKNGFSLPSFNRETKLHNAQMKLMYEEMENANSEKENLHRNKAIDEFGSKTRKLFVRDRKTDVLPETRNSKNLEPFTRGRCYCLKGNDETWLLRRRSTSVPAEFQMNSRMENGENIRVHLTKEHYSLSQ